MKKLILIPAILLGSATLSFAQSGTSTNAKTTSTTTSTTSSQKRVDNCVKTRMNNDNIPTKVVVPQNVRKQVHTRDCTADELNRKRK